MFLEMTFWRFHFNNSLLIIFRKDLMTVYFMNFFKCKICIIFSETGNSKLIASVKSATLSDQDAQSLIDILLIKQGGSPATLSADWNKVRYV
jgi:hypothetical protein